jgi:CubicO group peptidase (beta-lactamase class C family)
LVFTQDYFPGTKDAKGQFMGGTETMWLAGHDGKLFAAIGYGQDRPGTDPKPGAQILCKDSVGGPWRVDHGFEPNCMRVEGLISFAFTTDLHGKPLPKPVRRLIASPSELTRAGGASAFRGGRQTKAVPVTKLPPAENFKPRTHGDGAKAAGWKPDVLEKIDVEMQRHVAAPDVAGIVALISRHGKIGYCEAFGMQDREANKPMPKDAIFRLYSMTKPIVAAAALILFDEGKFTLDEPISKHCPEWKTPMVMEKGQKVPAKYPITPRMLMSHSSGLYYGTLEGGAFAGSGLSGREEMTLTEFSKQLAKQPLKFHPGTGYQYGHSIDILGRYVEAVSGKPLDEFLRERIFKPLKMTDTDFWVPAAKKDRIAQMYSQRRDGSLERGRDSEQLLEKPKLFLGGQGLVGTASDYARFCQMLLNKAELDGARVLKRETVAMMFQNHLKTPGQKYGLGGMVDGNGGYAWGGAAGTQFFVDSKNDLFAVFMVQTQRYRSPAHNDFKRLATAAITEGK